MEMNHLTQEPYCRPLPRRGRAFTDKEPDTDMRLSRQLVTIFSHFGDLADGRYKPPRWRSAKRSSPYCT